MRASVKRSFIRAAIALAAICTARFAYCNEGPKAHVAVLRIANGTGSGSYDAACKAATDTLTLTLREVGAYAVQSDEGASAGISEEGLRAMAAEEKLDFIVYGSMAAASGGGISCSLSVYDRAKGKTSLSRTRKAAGVLDIFDVEEELVVSVLESMTGSRIAFGSIELRNSGEPGSYSVMVDGQAVGGDLRSLDKVLIGRRRVTIAQRRMLGDREIASASVEVKEGSSALVEFSVPYLLDGEKAKLETLMSRIKEGMGGGAPGAAEAGIAELSSLVADVSYSPKLAAFRDQARQLGGEWALLKSRRDIEASAWDPKLEPLEAAGRVYEDAKSYPDPSGIKATFEENARLLSALLELKAGKALGAADIDGAAKAFGDELTLSTRYLGSERLVDLAYAALTLKGMKERAGARNAKETAAEAGAIFGPWIRAADRFAELHERAQAGKARVLVASDVSRPLSVDGGDYAEAPLALPAAAGAKPPRVRPKGAGDEAAPTAGDRLIFVQDGYAAFGKTAAAEPGASAPPGAIAVSCSTTAAYLHLGVVTYTASLDGGDPVELPHTFEGVQAGVHIVKIPDVLVGTQAYHGIEESVTVQPGKRLEYSPTLELGQAKLSVTDIPAGSTLLLEGSEIGPLSAAPDGTLAYEGTVDAGNPKIEVVNDNKTWWVRANLPIDSSERYTIRGMTLIYTVPYQTIRMRGKDEDWQGVETIFGALSSFPKNMPGSKITGGRICRDKKNIYIRIDFANGSPYSSNGCTWYLDLGQVHLELDAYSGGKNSSKWLYKSHTSTNCGDYHVGDSFIELKFPFSAFSRDTDLTVPIYAHLAFWVQSTNSNYVSPGVYILIGK